MTCLPRSVCLVALVLLAHLHASADPVAVPPDGPAQMPILYVKGFNDDGTSWARDTYYMPDGGPGSVPELAKIQLELAPMRSPARLLEAAGIGNFAVQWWGSTAGGVAPPTTSVDRGFAFLQTADELLVGSDWMSGTWTAQNRPVPGPLDVLGTPNLGPRSALDAALSQLGLPNFLLPDDLQARRQLSSALAYVNNYNDAGPLDGRAEDMLEMLRRERQPGGRLHGVRQINVVTHSMGSLIARAALSKAADAGVQDGEFVSNAIYNAPPWGGSTLAYLNVLWFNTPTTVTIFDDPIARKMAQAWVDQRTDEIDAREFTTFFLGLLTWRDQTGVDEFLDSMGAPVTISLDALEALTITAGGGPIPWTDPLVRVALTQAAAVLERAKPYGTANGGFPARPAADDLTPQGGIANLLDYTTSPYTRQWTAVGLGGVDSLLFPNDTATVVGNPNLIADPFSIFAQEDDIAVAEGSAKILTETSAFGPSMELIGPLANATHGDLGNRSTLIVPMWLERLLTSPTTLWLDGFVERLDSGARAYLVDASSTLDFTADAVDHTIVFPDLPGTDPIADIVVQNAVDRFEYRVVYEDGTQAPGGWQTHGPAQPPRTFGDLRTSLGIPDVPFFLEWRSVNSFGGREMIRSARISIVGEAPIVTQTQIVAANLTEVYRPPASNRLGNAVRGEVFDRLAASDPLQQALLATLRARPESAYVLKEGASKGLALIFDKSGSVEYVWDDPTFASPTRVDDVTSLFLAPLDLGEGPHTLYYQTITVTGAVETRSPLQALGVTIDDTAPAVTFQGSPNHPLGIAVSPQSPLIFQIEDVHANAGSGTLIADPNNPIAFDSGEVFTLAQTTLGEQLETAGAFGGFFDLEVQASDLVGNTTTQSFQVYFDITPPDLALVELVGALPTGPDQYRVFGPTAEIAVNLSDLGAGFADPPQAFVGGGPGGQVQPFGELTLGAVAGHPTSWGISVELPLGETTVQIRAQDIAGNVSLLTLEVEHDPEISDQDPLRLLSPRLAPDACWDAQGQTTDCSQGVIDAVAHSHHGDVFLFASSGERFAPGDDNSASDIFMIRDGELTRISEAPDGSEADGGSTRPALSGDGRYAFFMSNATNLVPGTSGANFYVRDLDSGQMAVISRRSDGTPANMSGNLSTRPLAPTRTGRYVFFESRSTQHLSGVSDTNGDPDIFMVDLDPDANGDFFDDNYVTVGISKASPTAMANDLSQKPSVTYDGRAVVYRTQATNLHPDLGDNGAIADALLMVFDGSAEDGTLDVSSPEAAPMNREAFFNGTSVTPGGVDDVRINPTTGDVAFSTRSNLSGTGDTNSQTNGRDVYLSFENNDPQNRFIMWVSNGLGGVNSSNTVTLLQEMAIADHEPITQSDWNKVGWVSRHTNIVSGDTNGVADLFRSQNEAPVTSGLAVPNWIAPGLPSGAAVLRGGFTGDGRWAWFVTNQEYASPYSPNGVNNLYLRRLDPPVTTTLSLSIVGGGTVTRDFPAASPGDPLAFDYSDDETVDLVAVADPGFRFAGWSGVDRDFGGGVALVRMHSDRAVTATFEATVGPTAASAAISTLEDTKSAGVAPVITGDPEQAYTITLVTQPANGIASVEAGLLYYDPAPDFDGADSFTFQVTNPYGQSLPAPATATVTVLDANDPPTATSLALIAADGIPGCPGVPVVVDPTPNETFTFAMFATPSDGAVALNVDTFVYTGDPGHVGVDDFSYLVTDSGGNTITGLATVSIAALVDTDGNGAPDLPPCMDADGDDLADVYETDTGSYASPQDTGTDPTDPDSDGDGWLDGEEVAAGTNPNDAASTPGPPVPLLPPYGALGLGLGLLLVGHGIARRARGPRASR